MNPLKTIFLNSLLATVTSASLKAQSAAGSHILNTLRAAASESIRSRKVPDGNYMVFTLKNCLACFKQLQDSMKALTGTNAFAVILLMKEEPLSIQSYQTLLARSGVHPKSYWVHYYDVDTNVEVQKLLLGSPSPWLIQKKKNSIQLQTYSDLKPLFRK